MAGIGAAGFGGGFGRGLANVLMGNREQQRQQENLAEQRRMQGYMAVLPVALQQLQDTGDPAFIEEIITNISPDFAKKFKKEGSPFQFLGPLLQTMGQIQAPDASQTGTGADVGLTGALGATPAETTAPPPPLQPTRVAGVQEAPKTLFGGRVLSPEQRAEQEASRQTGLSEAQIQAKVNIARKLAAEGMPLEEAYDRVGLSAYGRGAAIGYQSVPGELPDGSPAFGVFDRRTGTYLDPQTQEPLEGFRPRTTTASQSLGTEREALAREMFGVPASRLDQGQMAELNAALPDYIRRTARERGLGAGEAQVSTKLDMPLDTQEAARQDVPFTTSMRDLEGLQPITADQAERRQALIALRPQIDDIRSMVARVFPDYTGVEGAARSSAELARKRAGRDPDFMALEAAINLAIGNVARVLAAETGRLTEQDAERARSALADLKGWTDTRASALAKLAMAEKSISAIAGSIKTPGEQRRERDEQANFSTFFQGKTYTFDSQAKLDLFKRQFGIQ